MTLQVNQNPIIYLGDDLEVCEGDIVTFSAGNGFVNYAWSDGTQTADIQVNQAGSYSVTVIDSNGCEGSDQVALFTHSQPIVLSQPMNQTAYLMDDAIFSVAATNVSSYQWQTNLGLGYQNLFDAGQYSGVNTFQLTVSNLASSNDGQLFRCILSNWECADTSSHASLQVRNELSIREDFEKQIKVFPNPAREEINILHTELHPNMTATFYDSAGKRVLSTKINALNTRLNLIGLSSGSYWLRVSTSEKIAYSTLIQLQP